MASFLSLSASERQSAQQAMDQFMANLRRLEVASLQSIDQHPATVNGVDGDKYSFFLPGLDSEGQALKSWLAGSLRQSLGYERTEMFFQKADLEKGLGDLGKEGRTLTFINRVRPDGGFERRLGITEKNATTWMPIGDEIPLTLRHLFTLAVPGSHLQV